MWLTKLAILLKKECIINNMMVISISQAKVIFSELIEKVLKGEEVIITKYGKPVAKLVIYRGK